MPQQKRVLIPLPSQDFDTTEVVVPWYLCREAGFQVDFATPDGKRAYTDPYLLTGVVFGQLGADQVVVQRYHQQLELDPDFLHPLVYGDIDPEIYDGLILPGGHAKGMTVYLESATLQKKVLHFWKLGRPVGAICHGPIVLARTIDPQTGQAVVYGKKMTSLTKSLERTAYWLTAWARGRYYRTYPEYVQDEVTRHLQKREDYVKGPSFNRPFIVEDGQLLTARWPKDAALFAETFIRKVGVQK
ncbi:type 1 glutamine amidotransferase domain-containing protein [Paenibacillus sp. NPDC056722]|uniref:type 1 glutamine amidotransferase domain-containing protein n=1 Tax=Paenibacillus sp. NPDC056722 TaxID=3345924 RepID=UPI0036B3F037